MTDMTTEQALEWLESLRNTAGDQVCAEIEAGKAAQAAQAFRAALSRPAVPEGWRKAMKRLVLVARTTGGTAGTDADLMAACAACEDLLAAAPEPAEQHPDDAAVDQFAQVMKAKLAKARAKGRSGWDDPAQCSPEYLADLLAGHVRKGNDGNFVDVANFAMMLHQRGAAPSVMPDAIRRSTAEESLTTEQPEDGPAAWLVDYGDGSDPEAYVGERPPGVAVECSMTPLYPESVKAERDALRERVKELVGIIDDIRHWDISNLSLDIPLPLRKRMQKALAAMQEGKA